MKSVIVNRKNLVVFLVVVLISVGAQGISYAQDADEYPPTSSISLGWGGVRAVIPSGQSVNVYTVANGDTVSVDSVRNARWQRREDSTSPWVDVPDSERATGLYGYVLTLSGDYRWVGEIRLEGVWGKYSSQNILQFTSRETWTHIPAEAEGVPSDPHKLTLEGHRSGILTVAFSSDSRTIASGSYDKTIQLWDVDTGEQKQKLEGHTSGVTTVAFSPDGSTLASGSWDTYVMLWDTETGKLLRTLDRHTDGVRAVAFSPDGRALATGGYDRTIRLWDVDTGEQKLTLEGHTDYVRGVVFSPDGSTLASGSYDRTIRLWDVDTGEQKLTLEGHTNGVLTVAFSPDGSRLASGSYDTTVRLWDIDTGEQLQVLREHKGTVSSVAFSSDGSTLATGADSTTILLYEDTILLWDTETWEPLQPLRGHQNDVYSVAFSPDGSALASGSYDSTIMLWEMTSVTVVSEPSQPEDVLSTDSSEPSQLQGDLNADGVVNIQDLVFVASQFGQAGETAADINEDGLVNIQDLVLVAGALASGDSAPAAHPQVVETLTAEEINRWLRDAHQLKHKDVRMARGIMVLKDLLALLTPAETVLLHNYPNPFNPETWIPYQLKSPAVVHIAIYNPHGILVRELSLGYQAAGRYTSRARAAYWDGQNTAGEPVASGLYFYTLTAADFSATRRMVILK